MNFKVIYKNKVGEKCIEEFSANNRIELFTVLNIRGISPIKVEVLDTASKNIDKKSSKTFGLLLIGSVIILTIISFCIFKYLGQLNRLSENDVLKNNITKDISLTNKKNKDFNSKNSKKFHKPDCSSVEKISANNKAEKTCTRDELIEDGYSACGICKP
jgi:hypothetical protein